MDLETLSTSTRKGSLLEVIRNVLVVPTSPPLTLFHSSAQFVQKQFVSENKNAQRKGSEVSITWADEVSFPFMHSGIVVALPSDSHVYTRTHMGGDELLLLSFLQ